MLGKVSIIIPTYNESKNLPIVVNKLLEISEAIAKELEIVIVDDNSPDGTGKVADLLAAEHPNIRVIHRPRKMGVGSAVHEGIKAANAPHVVMMDADLHHRPEFVPSITKYLAEYEIVIASRFIEGSEMKAKSLGRRLVTKLGNALARGILRLDVRDYTHGFRGYERSAFLECYRPKDTGGEFNIRLLIEAQKRGYRTKEVPYHSEHGGRSKVSSWLGYLQLLIREPFCLLLANFRG
jgi:dolichol-phosphate mannosyltransferase